MPSQEASTVAAQPKASRVNETRQQETRVTEQHLWKPLDQFPVPVKAGYKFHWIRWAIKGQPDAKNMSRRRREGWVPVHSSEFPELNLYAQSHPEHPDSICIEDLI